MESLPEAALKYDASSDYRREGVVYYTEAELSGGARLDRRWMSPAPAVAFGYYLVKKIGKGSLPLEVERKLADLLLADPEGGEKEAIRLLGERRGKQATQAIRQEHWAEFRTALPDLRRTLLWRARRRHPIKTTGYLIQEARRLIDRVLHPTGLHLVVLGPDGSGKSTLVQNTQYRLSPLFRHQNTAHWAPRLLRRRAAESPVTNPHRRPPRSPATSALKLLYLWVDFTLGYALRVRLPSIRSTLVVYDRYFVDLLVDPRRYRYGGPMWLAQIAWRLVPKPDLVLLLDAPAEAIHHRRQEVPIEETVRQRRAYRALVEAMPNGHVLDATLSADEVAIEATRIVLDYMEFRTAHRLGIA